MNNLADPKRCPSCGAPVAELPMQVVAPAPEPVRPATQHEKLAEGLRNVVARYTAHNNELERSLRASPIGGRFAEWATGAARRARESSRAG